MKNTNKYKSETNKIDTPTFEGIAEAWLRICLFHIRHKKQLTNQYQDKKYGYQTT
jgi:hypothetical protein